MTLVKTTPTPQLARWLAHAHDDGTAPLVVTQIGPDLEVLHVDGSELTEAEQVEVVALAMADLM